MAKLGEVCEFYAGTGFPNEYQGRVTGKYPFYKVGDISKNVLEGNRELKTCANYVEEDVVQKLKGSILPPKTIVFAKIGEALKLNRRAITSCECLVDNNVMGIKAQNVRLNDEYFFYWLQNLNLSDYSESTTVPSVKKSRLQNIEINVNPLEEQEKVVSTLNKLSSLILARKKQLSKLDELVKARFVEMFGGYVPNAKLSDVASITGGLTKNSNRNKMKLKLPYLRVANVSYAKIDVSEMLEIGLTEDEKAKTLLSHDDLLFVEGNGSPDQIGRVALWRNEITPCVHQNHLIKVRFISHLIVPCFALYYFMSQEGRKQIRSKAVSTSGLYTLSVSKISNLLIPTPPLSLQNQFATFVERVDQQKQTVQQSLEKLELMKKALMQEYFG